MKRNVVMNNDHDVVAVSHGGTHDDEFVSLVAAVPGSGTDTAQYHQQQCQQQQAPMSGRCPSPTGGLVVGRAQQLRHRSHGSGGSAGSGQRQQQQKQWHQQQQALYSLDDADAAGGTTMIMEMTSLLQHHQEVGGGTNMSHLIEQQSQQQQLPQAIHASRTFPPYSNINGNNNNDNGYATTSTTEALFSISSSTASAATAQQQQQYAAAIHGDILGTATIPTGNTNFNNDVANNNNNNNNSSNNNNNSKEVFQVLGYDLTNSTRQVQFIIPTMLTFTFSLVYGYLQELIAVTLCNRQLGLFLALVQFLGYTLLSYCFRSLQKKDDSNNKRRRIDNSIVSARNSTIPLEMYLGLSILRAIDLGMTNMAMKYINYPAKTIMKSTRVLFTMIFGILVNKKRYGLLDFIIVALMVIGLAIFFHADFHTSAVFHPLGIIMLCISLLCDGAISNFSETLMNQYNVGQDEYIFRLYSIATVFIGLATCVTGDLVAGIHYLTHHGTYKEIESGSLDPTWSISWKILTLVLLSTSGFLSSSCSALITKSFGALTSSITSTARKAATIFLSFALFPNNKCTLEHLFGIFFFITSLVTKSLRHSRKRSVNSSSSKEKNNPGMLGNTSKAKGSNGVLTTYNVTTSDDGASEISMYPNYTTNNSTSPPYLRRKTIADGFV